MLVFLWILSVLLAYGVGVAAANATHEIKVVHPVDLPM
jgi:predicted outer membrane lipoprotein